MVTVVETFSECNVFMSLSVFQYCQTFLGTIVLTCFVHKMFRLAGNTHLSHCHLKLYHLGK